MDGDTENSKTLTATNLDIWYEGPRIKTIYKHISRKRYEYSHGQKHIIVSLWCGLAFILNQIGKTRSQTGKS